MSKLKAFAAVLKFINGRNDDADSLRDVCNYTTDKAKTKDGMLIATQGCSLEHPVEDILANKRLHHQTHGKQYEHYILAPCPDGSNKSPEDVLKAAKDIVATVFSEHMAVITVHTDTKIVHAHTVLDALNAITGKKFSQSSSDLNRVKQKANNILQKHGFELIKASANDFVDRTDYSNEEDFCFLELDESQFITEAMVEEISVFTDSFNLNDEFKDYSNAWYQAGDYNNNNYGGYPMNNYIPYTYQPQAVPVTTPTAETVSSAVPMVQQTQDLPAPTVNVDAVPATIEPGNVLPNTNIITGPTFRITGAPESNFAGLNELVEQTMTDAQKHQREAANLALAMQQYGQQTGYPSNVSVYAGPIFDIDTNGMCPPFPVGGNNNPY